METAVKTSVVVCDHSKTTQVVINDNTDSGKPFHFMRTLCANEKCGKHLGDGNPHDGHSAEGQPLPDEEWLARQRSQTTAFGCLESGGRQA